MAAAAAAAAGELSKYKVLNAWGLGHGSGRTLSAAHLAAAKQIWKAECEAEGAHLSPTKALYSFLI